ncbi:hypothetical protein D3C81_1638940 [compost metagenome]
MDFICRYQDGTAAFSEFVGNVGCLQRRHDGAAVAIREIGEKHLVFRLLAPQHQCDHDRDDGCAAQHEHDLAAIWRFRHVHEGVLHIGGGACLGRNAGWQTAFACYDYCHDCAPARLSSNRIGVFIAILAIQAFFRSLNCRACGEFQSLE